MAQRYIASEDGWTEVDFNEKSKSKDPTLILIRIKDGSCIGAFTSSYYP